MDTTDKIIRNNWETKTITELSKMVGLSYYLTVKRAKKMGLANKRKIQNYFKVLPDCDINYIKENWFTRELKEIGKMLKIHPIVVGNIGKKLGLPSKLEICKQRRDSIRGYISDKYNVELFTEYPKTAIKDICKIFKIERRTAEQDLKTIGMYISISKKERYTEIDSYIMDNWEKINIQTIAKSMGVSRHTIWKHVKKLSLTPKNRKGINSGKWKGGCCHSNKRKMNAIRKSRKGYAWGRDVKLRDKLSCRKCGHTGHRNKYYGIVGVTAHHIYNFYDYPNKRFDTGNGITLCIKCHEKFHKQYGYRYTDKNQLKEFLKDD